MPIKQQQHLNVAVASVGRMGLRHARNVRLSDGGLLCPVNLVQRTEVSVRSLSGSTGRLRLSSGHSRRRVRHQLRSPPSRTRGAPSRDCVSLLLLHPLCRVSLPDLLISTISFYASFEDMLKHPGLDAVIVASSTAQHAPMAIAALDAGLVSPPCICTLTSRDRLTILSPAARLAREADLPRPRISLACLGCRQATP